MSTLSTGQVFISYSRKDQDVMWRAVKFLREQGIKVWLDNEKLIPGTPIWEEEIEKAIKAASAVIVIMSPDSKNSEWVRREISLADQNRKQIFPVLVRGDEDSSITLRLITRQFVDMRENEATGLNSLYAALGSYLDNLNTQISEAPPFEKAPIDRNVDAVSPPPQVAREAVSREALLILLAWTVAGAIGGVGYNATANPLVGGTIGGLATAFGFHRKSRRSSQKQLTWLALAWPIGVAIGWMSGELLTEASGIAMGYAIGIAISVAMIVFLGKIAMGWKSVAWIVLAWTIGAALGWWFTKRILIEQLSLDYEIAWAIGTAIGWTIGGFVSARELLGRRAQS